MVKVSYEQKPFRREVMRTYGASVTPSPSTTTEVGKKILKNIREQQEALAVQFQKRLRLQRSMKGIVMF